MAEIVLFWKGLSKLNQPRKGVPGANTNFDHLKKAIDDPLIPVKLAFLPEIASKLNLFLLVFQSDKPMIPFLVEVLENLLRRTLLKKMFLKLHDPP